MKNGRRKRDGGGIPWKGRSSSRSFWCTLTVVLCCALLSALTFSTFRLFGVSFRPVLIATWPQAAVLKAVSGGPGGGDTFFLSTDHHRHRQPIIRHAVSFPDQLVLFLSSPSESTHFAATDHLLLRCVYFPPDSPEPSLNLSPISIDGPDPPSHPYQLVRCPLSPRNFRVSLSATTSSSPTTAGHRLLPPVDVQRWEFLAYESLQDHHDNTTVVFVKGLNLRPDRFSDPSRFECVYGWDFSKPKYLLAAEAITAAQEIIRCRTPLSVRRRAAELPGTAQSRQPLMVSVRIRGRGGGILPSAARPVCLGRRPSKHNMCVCTMVRNQARFLREWIAYHARIGVQRWFIYDNDSNDSLEDVVRSIDSSGYNVTRHIWPWAKTQEAGFAHCALRARDACEWVGFIDVDEFLYLPLPPPSSGDSNPASSLQDVLRNYSENFPQVGELRTVCHSFGPSGRKTVPVEGVTLAYTCRMAAPERHKSIVRPEALSSALLNVVHHFHLKDGFTYVNVDQGVMVINHYKYQVWDVFKEKFYRRVATYVADWHDKENVGSKDRAPGLGTEAVEPPDWPSRFCEVNDTGLKDWVLRVLVDPDSGLLQWS